MKSLILAASLTLAACSTVAGGPAPAPKPQPISVMAILSCGITLAFEIVYSDGSEETLPAAELEADPALAKHLNLAISVSKHHAVDIRGNGCSDS